MALAYNPTVWTDQQLAEILNCPEIKNTGISISSVDTSAENCEPGSLYVPVTRLPHGKLIRRLENAFSRGAVAALTANPETRDMALGPTFLVNDTKDALLELARAGRARFEGECIAITGSVGKTTVKEMTGTVVSACLPSVISKGNANIERGILSTLASIPKTAKTAIIEVSTALPGIILKRAREINPTIAIITNIGLSHGGRFKPGGLLTEKLSLLDYLEKGGVAILGESVQGQDSSGELRNKINIGNTITVGWRKSADVRVTSAEVTPSNTLATIDVLGKTHKVFIPVSGTHFAESAAFAMAAAHAMQLDLHQVASAFRSYTPYKRRNVRWKVNQENGQTIEVLDDSYNAAPASVAALLFSLENRNPPGRKILVLGDMLELGDDSEQHHLALRQPIVGCGIDLLLTVGPMAALAGQGLPAGIQHLEYRNSSEAASRLVRLLKNGDLIAIKGSNAMKLEKVVKALINSGHAATASPHWSIERKTRKLSNQDA